MTYEKPMAPNRPGGGTLDHRVSKHTSLMKCLNELALLANKSEQEAAPLLRKILSRLIPDLHDANYPSSLRDSTRELWKDTRIPSDAPGGVPLQQLLSRANTLATTLMDYAAKNPNTPDVPEPRR